MNQKTCITCLKDLDIDNFKIVTEQRTSTKCKNCLNIYNANLAKDTYDPFKRREKYLKNKDKHLQKCKDYRDKNKELIKLKDRKRKSKGGKPKPRIINSPFRIRSITGYLKHNINNKYLPNSTAEIKAHLESLFEPWMTWNNIGVYSASKWDDNDSNTWKWQVDHIIPYADLPYISAQDDNFKKLWSLNNIRPLSAKQNCIDGAKRTRHSAPKIIVKYKKQEKIYNQELIDKIQKLFDGKLGARAIAKKLGITRHKVMKIYKFIGIDNSNIKISKKEIPKEKACKKCCIIKEISNYRKRKSERYESTCLECESFYNKKICKQRYEEFGRSEFIENYKDPEFKKKHLENYKIWYDNHKKQN